MVDKTLTIAIPTHNSSNTITRTLDSIRKQTNQDWKMIIRDDGSHDDSLAILHDYIEGYGLSWKIIAGDHLGTSFGRKEMLDMCETDYIFFIDSDDVLTKDTAIETIFEHLKEDDYDFLYLNISATHVQNHYSGDLFKDLCEFRVQPRITNVYKADKLKALEWLPVSYKEDWYLNALFFLQYRDLKYKWIDEKLYRYVDNIFGMVRKCSDKAKALATQFYESKISRKIIELGLLKEMSNYRPSF